jgi:hypothetical protein
MQGTLSSAFIGHKCYAQISLIIDLPPVTTLPARVIPRWYHDRLSKQYSEKCRSTSLWISNCDLFSYDKNAELRLEDLDTTDFSPYDAYAQTPSVGRAIRSLG